MHPSNVPVIAINGRHCVSFRHTGESRPPGRQGTAREFGQSAGCMPAAAAAGLAVRGRNPAGSGSCLCPTTSTVLVFCHSVPTGAVIVRVSVRSIVFSTLSNLRCT